MRVKDAVGQFGEDTAAARLQEAGWEILARNWRPPRGSSYGVRGELDIVARDGDTVVFIEVKTRSSTAFGQPSEAIGFEKARRIRRLAAVWLAAQPASRQEDAPFDAVRFDVVSVLRGSSALSVEHLRGAF
jgi:putative endonuclease